VEGLVGAEAAIARGYIAIGFDQESVVVEVPYFEDCYNRKLRSDLQKVSSQTPEAHNSMAVETA
jgi:hypothetical protein